MPRLIQRMLIRRLLLPLCLLSGVIGVVLIASVWSFANNADRHLGADYLGFASEVVRGQQDGVYFQQAIESLVDNPEPLHQQQALERLWIIATRRGSINQYLERSALPEADYQHIRDEYRVLSRLMREAEPLLAAAPYQPERLAQLDALSTELDDSLAFIYSELQHIVFGSAAEQQRLMQRLSRWLIALATLVMVVITALMVALYQIDRQKRKVEALSVTDELTGLNNRRALLDQAGRLFAQGLRSGTPLSMALIDIDHFKQVNDDHGHPTGDRMLVAVAALLREHVRRADVVARIGGEEFCILMPHTDATGAAELCERLRRAVAEHAFHGAPGRTEGLSLTVSVGVTTSRTDTAPPDDSFAALYPRADQALYLAKQNGRNRVEVG
ncbi:GGDEF domain-containing protein [Halomonas sp. ML-15]|uniref:GGDEF domain-containing protein n=1 Tax=Halomonas sp. ML-15 TaxID=2773305 RepID=UPI001747C4C2|nr:GGDEF domain-containing protein [Halomonas sp. ML-15]MBD3896112.1 GGDEF domain-containing protein [Halomonas sp. ML-15]